MGDRTDVPSKNPPGRAGPIPKKSSLMSNIPQISRLRPQLVTKALKVRKVPLKLVIHPLKLLRAGTIK